MFIYDFWPESYRRLLMLCRAILIITMHINQNVLQLESRAKDVDQFFVIVDVEYASFGKFLFDSAGSKQL